MGRVEREWFSEAKRTQSLALHFLHGKCPPARSDSTACLQWKRQLHPRKWVGLNSGEVGPHLASRQRQEQISEKSILSMSECAERTGIQPTRVRYRHLAPKLQAWVWVYPSPDARTQIKTPVCQWELESPMKPNRNTLAEKHANEGLVYLHNEHSRVNIRECKYMMKEMDCGSTRSYVMGALQHGSGQIKWEVMHAATH